MLSSVYVLSLTRFGPLSKVLKIRLSAMENEKEITVFKVPQSLFGPRPGSKKPIKYIVDTPNPAYSDNVPTTANVTEDSKDNVEIKIDQPKKVAKQSSQIPIPYEEPSWGGKPGEKYFLEVREATLYLKVGFYFY